MIFGLLTPHVIAAICLLIAIRTTAKPSGDALEVVHSSRGKWLGRIGMTFAFLALVVTLWVGMTAGLSVTAWFFFFIYGAAMLVVIGLALYWLAVNLL